MKKFLFGCFAMAALAACSSDDGGSDPITIPEAQFEKGTLAYIKDYIGETAYNNIVEQGFELHLGKTPPTIEGVYEINGSRIFKTNVPNDISVGSSTGPHYLIISNQDNANLNVSYSSKHHRSGSNPRVENNSDEGYPVISGNGDRFTMVAKVNSEVGNLNVEGANTIHIISGKKTSEGIVDFQLFVYMVNNHGNTNTFFTNKKSRVYVDTDGTVEPWD
ncbi:membrane lipoprotein lipid attachment site-containing protein [Flavobacterium sp.]|uniref:membrane lipoprotein lipid attachment site-containing protein n=1 Tax=Flavobacterium sp. TaxID=239 RepID=UPI0039E6D332